MHEFNK